MEACAYKQAEIDRLKDDHLKQQGEDSLEYDQLADKFEALEAQSKELTTATRDMVEVLRQIDSKRESLSGWGLGQIASTTLARHASLIAKLKEGKK